MYTAPYTRENLLSVSKAGRITTIKKYYYWDALQKLAIISNVYYLSIDWLIIYHVFDSYSLEILGIGFLFDALL